MRQYWANFAHTGRPSAEGEPEWTPYSIPDRSVLILDAERRVEIGFDDAVRQFWFE
jgi:para-nitrobenzyl esterase